MKYIEIDVEYEPAITGSPNGIYAVEMKGEKSFRSKKEMVFFNEFIDANMENLQRVCDQNFVAIDEKNISKITYFPSYKRTKDIDVVNYSPHQMGFQFLLSEKAFKIIIKYKTPKLNVIPAKIETFDKKYYMIGFPMIENEMIDFKLSTFYDHDLEKEVTYKNFKDYNQINFSRNALNIHLKKSYNYDIIHLQGEGVYFSKSIIAEIKANELIGFLIRKSMLHNETE